MSRTLRQKGSDVRAPAYAPVRLAVIGCGLIGRRRAEVARQAGSGETVVVADVDESRARALAGDMGCAFTTDWQEAIAREDVEAVVVATSNNWLAPATIAAVRCGKHVLVEKPMARNPVEAGAVVRALEAGRESEGGSSVVVAVGFNHRRHAGIGKAHELYRQGAIGDILFIRCRYGHGGRPGYEKEWRMDPEISGGGELLDQGVHAVDLFRWFLGDFAEAFGFTAAYVWTPDGGSASGPGGSPVVAGRVEDNGFALFRTAAGQVATLHASCTQWKNLFSFEVFGRTGHLIVEGLGGSYGPERLRVGRRRMEGGAPEEETLEFPGADVSWQAEWQEFVAAIREDRAPVADAHDGLQAMRMVHAVYESARTQQVVKL